MIERGIDLFSKLSNSLCDRFEKSLFSLSIVAEIEITPQIFTIQYNSIAVGKSVSPRSFDQDIRRLQKYGTTWSSGYSERKYGDIAFAEVHAFEFTRAYLSTIRTVMEGKQGVVGFDFLSMRTLQMMKFFEKAADEVFKNAGEILVIDASLTNPSDFDARVQLWDTYLACRGITKEDWVLGF